MGPRRTPALAAAYASEYNANFGAESELGAAFDRVRQALAQVGRDPGTLKLSTAQHTVGGRTDAEYRERAGRDGVDPEAHRARNLGGSVAEMRDRIDRYGQLGVGRVYLQVLAMTDLDHLELLAELL